MPLSPGTRARHELDRSSQAYKQVYKQRTATERVNSQAVELGIERPKDRLIGSLACAAAAVLGGASIVRAHDVAETVATVQTCHALVGGGVCQRASTARA